jgi:hypothetical protein
MPSLVLQALVADAQKKRSLDRSVARAFKIMADDKSLKLKTKRPFNLESLGLLPHTCLILRKQWPGKTDTEISDMLKGKGIL